MEMEDAICRVRDVRQEVDEQELHIIKYYLEEYVPEGLTDLIPHGKRPACILTRISFKDSTRKSESQEFLNSEAEVLFEYTTAEFNYFNDLRDMESLLIFKQTGVKPCMIILT